MFRSIKNIIITVIVLIAVASLTAAGILLNENNLANQRQQAISVELNKCLARESDVIISPTTDGSTTSASACPTLITTTCFHQSTNGWLVVNTPCTAQQITSTLKVKGVAFGAFESTLNYELVNAANRVIATGAVNVSAPEMGLPGNIDQNITFDPAVLTANAGNGKFRIYMVSARDGSQENVVEISVNL